ncbi:hypothetical protein Tco_0269767 [Tanacetum coccineum]
MSSPVNSFLLKSIPPGKLRTVEFDRKVIFCFGKFCSTDNYFSRHPVLSRDDVHSVGFFLQFFAYPDIRPSLSHVGVEVDFHQKTEKQAKMTQLSMGWTRLCKNQGQSSTMPKSEYNTAKIISKFKTGLTAELKTTRLANPLPF